MKQPSIPAPIDKGVIEQSKNNCLFVINEQANCPLSPVPPPLVSVVTDELISRC